MNSLQLTPLPHPVRRTVHLPGCIGYTIRALNIAMLTKGTVKIVNPLKSDDTYAMLTALKELGITIEEEADTFVIHGDIDQVENKEYTIDIRKSGRSCRTLLATLCVIPGTKMLTCEESFKKRPIGDLVDGLRQLGAEITYLEQEGHLPVKITSGHLHPGIVRMKGNMSSQYFSAIMMIAPRVGEIAIEVIGYQSSKPFIDMTIEIMKTFGVSVENKQYKSYEIAGQQIYNNPQMYIVEPETTSASYFLAIAAVTNSTIRILNLGPDSKQGDVRFVDILQKMGCAARINKQERWIEVEGTDQLRGITVSMNDTPDLVPTLAVVAAFAKGTTKITDIGHVRLKETDRISAPKKELEKMGIHAVETHDSLTIDEGQPHGATIHTYGDHRMAMAFAVAGAKIPGIEIQHPDVVNKSFPNFWEKLEEIGIKVERTN